MKQKPLKYLPVGFLFLFLTSYHCNAQEIKKAKSPKPNIIFIFADDWGYGDLGCYGNKEVSTPNLDKMASQGTRYTQFHVTSGVCSPSRTSVLTGHYPARYNIHGHFAGNEINKKRQMPNWLSDTLPVYLPKLMHKAGYATAHFGKWHLGGGGLPNGDPSAPDPKQYGYDEARVWNGNGPTWKGDQQWATTRLMDEDTLWVQNSSKLAVNETISFIKKNNGKAPMFINLWLKDPHTPLWPSEQQRKPYKGITPDKETYYSVLTDADYHIGRLFKVLSELGLDENTLVIFSSDNGPAGYAPALNAGSTAGLKGRKTDLYQGGINVPFIVKWSGHIKPGIVDSTSVLSTVDLLPSFVELAQASLPKDYIPDGQNINSIFKNKPFKRTKSLYWDWRFPIVNQQPKNATHWAKGAIRKEDWKLLLNIDINRVELYNIKKDPLEKNNISNLYPRKAQKLIALWKNWKQTLPNLHL